MTANNPVGWMILYLFIFNLTIAQAYPQTLSQEPQQINPSHYVNSQINRKFAEKPNTVKKVALEDIDDIQTNQIQDVGFSWSNMLGMLMQMMFNGGTNVPTKSDDIDNGGTYSQSPWANVISVGLKIITALLGGGTNDGIDKVDNGSSPMQFINIVVNLLDALKTSFSHRSLSARNLGRKDSLSDATIAGITVLKTYARSYEKAEDKCLLKYICEANNDCVNAVGGSSIFCQLGNYVTSYIIERTTAKSFEILYEAGRNGRLGLDCRQLYLECNEV
ncbi:uncharacterized protein LOC129722601 isoform X2 [Wyeomyia smithii]|uniref:uncharacterized protein LOC129722601 isoform X2 n=1 Tax=Wyeomyia smithii TaxID=174621 RepID=UPI002467D9C6|nr:uncharacterized protein LOC129722601 isoform X2 [Wyeomyia smithii]